MVEQAQSSFRFQGATHAAHTTLLEEDPHSTGRIYCSKRAEECTQSVDSCLAHSCGHPTGHSNQLGWSEYYPRSGISWRLNSGRFPSERFSSSRRLKHQLSKHLNVLKIVNLVVYIVWHQYRVYPLSPAFSTHCNILCEAAEVSCTQDTFVPK